MAKAKERSQRCLVLSAVFVALIVSGCAHIVVAPLNPDGTRTTTQGLGLRYYLPKPFLLVMLLPAEPASARTSFCQKGCPDAGKSASKLQVSKSEVTGAVPSSARKPGEEEPTIVTRATPPSPSDTSFFASTNRYVVKLIYLPDLRHPMAVGESPGFRYRTSGRESS
jgi:hypothetical protein